MFRGTTATTLTVAVSVTEVLSSHFTVITVEPRAVAVNLPAESIVPTVVLELDQVTLVTKGLPSWSLTAEVNWKVSRTSRFAEGLSVMLTDAETSGRIVTVAFAWIEVLSSGVTMMTAVPDAAASAVSFPLASIRPAVGGVSVQLTGEPTIVCPLLSVTVAVNVTFSVAVKE